MKTVLFYGLDKKSTPAVHIPFSEQLRDNAHDLGEEETNGLYARVHLECFENAQICLMIQVKLLY